MIQHMSERRYVGKWWVPSASDHKVGGVLEIGESGQSRLELTDELLGNEGAQILHGVADGRPITLFEVCLANGTKKNIAQHVTNVEVVRAGLVLVGIHLVDGEEECFSGVEVSISHLATWAQRSGISQFYESSVNGKSVSRHRAEFEPLDSVVARVNWDESELAFNWILTMTGPKDEAWSRSYHVDESVRLKIVSDKPRSLDGYDNLIQAVQDLVTLGVQSACVITDRVLLINRPDRRDYRVDLFFESGRAFTEEAIKPRSILFRLSDIDDFGATIELWLSLREKIGLPLHVLFGLDYDLGGYYENRIFNAASAAEGFHTALCLAKKAISDDDHAEIKARVDEVFDGKQKAWIKQRIGDNRPGLKDRYVELAAMADSESILKLVGDIDIWAKWLKNARNAIGHLNTDELDKKVPEGARVRLTDITKAMLHLILINQIGIGVEVQRRAVAEIFDFSARSFRKAVESAGQ